MWLAIILLWAAVHCSSDCCRVQASGPCSDSSVVDCVVSSGEEHSFCRSGRWDGLCISQAIASCGLTCAGESSCFGEGLGGPGCDSKDISECVCELDAFCCSYSWDCRCAVQAVLCNGGDGVVSSECQPLAKELGIGEAEPGDGGSSSGVALSPRFYLDVSLSIVGVVLLYCLVVATSLLLICTCIAVIGIFGLKRGWRLSRH